MATNGKGSYAGKVAFVTGAASGIGRATAVVLAGEGAGVVAVDVEERATGRPRGLSRSSAGARRRV